MINKAYQKYNIVEAFTVTPHMVRVAIDNGAIGTIKLDVRKFLLLTTSNLAEIKIIKDGGRVKDFSFYEREGLLENISVMPMLIYDFKTKKIEGHEGRHRAVALWRSGKMEIEVALQSRPKYAKGWGDVPDKLYGQFNNTTVVLNQDSFIRFDRPL